MKLVQTPHKIADTKKAAKNMAKSLTAFPKQATVVGLYGDLGSGKTTFMQFLGEALGIKEKILSPTFVIEKIYKINHPKFDHLIHIDAYRLESPSEMKHLGWAEILKNPRNLICVEWADKIESLLPENRISIRFSHSDKETRLIESNPAAILAEITE